MKQKLLDIRKLESVTIRKLLTVYCLLEYHLKSLGESDLYIYISRPMTILGTTAKQVDANMLNYSLWAKQESRERKRVAKRHKN